MQHLKKMWLVPILLVLLGAGVFLVLSINKKTPEPKVEPVAMPKEVWPKEKVIGTSVGGRSIKSYTYGKGKHHIVFVGGVHGGYEWNSVLLAYALMDYLDQNRTLIGDNLTVTIIPSANPDGVQKVVGKEGRFSVADVSTDKQILAAGRFNANEVDLNRNFDCKWTAEGKWQSKTVSAGSAPFSEPESIAIKNFVAQNNPSAVVFWHSQANTVYASECGAGILPKTSEIQNVYSKASGYLAAKSFDSYVVTGDATDWLASVHIPAITVELKTHESIEWEKNLAGIKALLEYYRLKK